MCLDLHLQYTSRVVSACIELLLCQAEGGFSLLLSYFFYTICADDATSLGNMSNPPTPVHVPIQHHTHGAEV